MLTKHLSHGTVQIAANALWTIKNLTGMAANQKNLEPLLQALVALLNSKVGPHIVDSVASCIANLTSDSKLNKQLVYQYQGLPALIRLLLKAGKDERLAEPVLKALGHMTRNHPSFEICQTMVRESGAIGTIIGYLSTAADPATGSPAFKWSTNRAAVHLIRTLAQNPANGERIREHKALELLFELLNRTNGASKNNGSSHQVDGVNVQFFICDILLTFNDLCKDQVNCHHLINLNFIPLCVEMIAYQSGVVISLVVAALSALANYPLGRLSFVFFFTFSFSSFSSLFLYIKSQFLLLTNCSSFSSCFPHRCRETFAGQHRGISQSAERHRERGSDSERVGDSIPHQRVQEQRRQHQQF